jgi:hypothetical protein
MIGSIGPQTGYYTLQQASQAQAAQSKLDLFSDVDESDDAPGSTSTSETQNSAASSSSASGPGSSMLSSTTLSSLLGLQMVNGQDQGGASGAQLNLPQVSQPSMDPNSFLSAQTLQMLQSIGA